MREFDIWSILTWPSNRLDIFKNKLDDRTVRLGFDFCVHWTFREQTRYTAYIGRALNSSVLQKKNTIINTTFILDCTTKLYYFLVSYKNNSIKEKYLTYYRKIFKFKFVPLNKLLNKVLEFWSPREGKNFKVSINKKWERLSDTVWRYSRSSRKPPVREFEKVIVTRAGRLQEYSVVTDPMIKQ